MAYVSPSKPKPEGQITRKGILSQVTKSSKKDKKSKQSKKVY
jgi:hypothetical protein